MTMTILIVPKVMTLTVISYVTYECKRVVIQTLTVIGVFTWASHFTFLKAPTATSLCKNPKPVGALFLYNKILARWVSWSWTRLNTSGTLVAVFEFNLQRLAHMSIYGHQLPGSPTTPNHDECLFHSLLCVCKPWSVLRSILSNLISLSLLAYPAMVYINYSYHRVALVSSFSMRTLQGSLVCQGGGRTVCQWQRVNTLFQETFEYDLPLCFLIMITLRTCGGISLGTCLPHVPLCGALPKRLISMTHPYRTSDSSHEGVGHHFGRASATGMK